MPNPSPLARTLAAAAALAVLLATGAQLAAPVWATSVVADPDDEDDDRDPVDAGDLNARGAFTCDLVISPAVLGQATPVAAVLERDRMHMAAQPGMQRKHVPIAFEFGPPDASGAPTIQQILSGGRYLFDTARDARHYRRFVTETFVLDGVQFLDRPEFLASDCHDWRVIGARDFKEIRAHQTVLRTERWSVSEGHARRELRRRWRAIRDEAGRLGLAGVWLLHNRREGLASLVYFADRVAPPDPYVPDFASLGALASMPPLGAALDDLGWPKVMDRTHWSWTIWFPFVAGDRGEASIWPNSPPLPAPFAGDGICEVSRGETYDTAPGDCLPTCGDGICQLGEATAGCPGDCVAPMR